MRFWTAITALIAFSALLAGCIDPITQIRSDHMAKKAIRSVSSGDTEQLASVLSNENDAEAIMAEFENPIPHGKIKYRGDSYLFPMSTYTRFYEVFPDPEVDHSEATPCWIWVTLVNHPLRVDGLGPKSPPE